MKIGSWELESIRNKILRDLYSPEEENHSKRKTEIVRQNREYYIEPFNSILQTLPEELIDEHKDFVTEINYLSPMIEKLEGDTPVHFTINESWTYMNDIAVINPVQKRATGYSQNQPAPQPLDPRLKDITEQLCEEIITLRSKRRETHDYLVATTHKYTGSLQLRKEWPASFHKYLPPEPVKVAKSAKETKKVVVDDMALPDHIHETMTNNLLEGD
tara:strand:+ start:4636 stop:5283 length:648 start_codon:yes stop_codon:yes gene_type:complete